MRTHQIVALALALTAVPLTGSAAESAPASNADSASIPFIGASIRDWYAASAEELYVQTLDRDWYRATFFTPCLNLPFAVEIGFAADTDRLDKFSSIVAGGESCKFRTFERSDGPPPRDAARAEAQEEEAAD